MLLVAKWNYDTCKKGNASTVEKLDIEQMNVGQNKMATQRKIKKINKKTIVMQLEEMTEEERAKVLADFKWAQ